MHNNNRTGWFTGYWQFIRTIVQSETSAGFWHHMFFGLCWASLFASLALWGAFQADLATLNENNITYLVIGATLLFFALGVSFCYWFMQSAQFVSDRHKGLRPGVWAWTVKPLIICILSSILSLLCNFIPFAGQLFSLVLPFIIPFWMLIYLFEDQGIIDSFQILITRLFASKETWYAIGCGLIMQLLAALVMVVSSLAGALAFIQILNNPSPEQLLPAFTFISVGFSLFLLPMLYSSYFVLYAYDIQLQQFGIATTQNHGTGMS